MEFIANNLNTFIRVFLSQLPFFLKFIRPSAQKNSPLLPSIPENKDLLFHPNTSRNPVCEVVLFDVFEDRAAIRYR